MPPPTLNSEEPLMHLLALGAFRRTSNVSKRLWTGCVLMHLLALGAF